MALLFLVMFLIPFNNDCAEHVPVITRMDANTHLVFFILLILILILIMLNCDTSVLYFSIYGCFIVKVTILTSFFIPHKAKVY